MNCLVLNRLPRMKRADNEYDDEDYEVQLERNAQSPPMTAEEIKKSEELYNVRLNIKTNFLQKISSGRIQTIWYQWASGYIWGNLVVET